MDTVSPATAVLKTKKHFEILDGLRGIAALAVVVFHFMEWVQPDYSKDFIGHGFLAVDFFFCLSGFVIAYAYDDRVKKIGIKEFFKSRLIRLHPLVIFGSVLGLLGFLFDPFAGHTELYSVGRIALIFLTSVLLIPFPVMPDRFFNLFSFNAPAWSLFWEYIANIVYALVLYRLSKRYLFILITLAGIAMCYIAWHSGSVMGGWGGPNFWDGSARVSYSFLAGMLVYRSGWIIKNKLGFIGLSILLTLTFLMPFSKLNWLTEPLVVLFFYPFLIALGAGSQLNGGIKKFCNFSGNISYPLYMTHYFAIWIFGNYYTAHKPHGMQLIFIILISVLLLVGFAWLVMVLYDIPLRKYLNNRRKQKLSS